MVTVIRKNGVDGGTLGLPPAVLEAFPTRLREELSVHISRLGLPEELRLRSRRAASVSRQGKNLFFRTVLTQEEMDRILLSLCGGSLYAHRESIAEGYLTLPDGIRVGVVGRAVIEEERVVGVYDVTGLNLRFPRRLPRFGRVVAELLRRQEAGRGVLVYAPPAGGKTTLLRAVAASLASGAEPMRVCLVDSREELSFSLEDPDLCVDVLRGYPRALGMEIATRTMNAQLIVCDEIGGLEEAQAILSAQNCGVPLLASAHGNTLAGLFRREGLLLLHRAGVFGAYVGVRRVCDGREPDYVIHSWEEADEYAEASGGVFVGG